MSTETNFIGYSGYQQRSWLMTPILNAVQGSVEERYMQKHVQARNGIERCFGLLKARWRCLLRDRVLHYHPYVASNSTTACYVLQNIALKAGLPPLQPLPAAHDDGDDIAMQDPPSLLQLIRASCLSRNYKHFAKDSVWRSI